MNATNPDDMVALLGDDPARYLDLSLTQLYSLSEADADRVRLNAARLRFEQLKSRVAMLGTLADKQGISEIRTLDDIPPLLFKATVYKSYPTSWLERGEFGKLTKWLGKLTSVDLSGVDVSSCELIEQWIAAVRAQSPIALFYNAGADGKMAFLPRTEHEWDVYMRGVLWMQQPFGSESSHIKPLQPGVDRVPVFYPHARHGARPWNYFLEFYERMFGKDLVNTPLDRMDADLMSLAGRIQEASRKGEEGALQINPALLARKDEIAAINADTPRLIETWTQRLVSEYRGQRLMIMGTMQSMYDLAQRFKAQGIRGAYAPDSIASCGGGFIDGVEPAGWQQEVCDYLGIRPSGLVITYGMAEMTSLPARCSQGKYHVPATTIPYLLDIETDEVLPRSGTQTGRFAFLDLLPDSCWGGHVTSDMLTITRGEACACGQSGPFIDGTIRRVPTGGNDKIGCAGSAKAHDDATEFLLKV